MKRLIKTSLAVFGLVRLLSASPSFAEEKSRAEQLGLDKICSLGTKGATTFEDRGVSPCDKDGKTSYYFCPKSTLAGIGYTAPPYGRMYAFERDGETYYVECRGKKLSRAMEFYENRNPKWEEYYDEGMLDSRHEWNENENKKLEEDYTRGKLLSRIVWDENGLEKGYDKEGRLTHICARYENGNIKRALIYTRGKLSRIIDWYKDRPKHFKPSEKISHP